MAPCLEWLLICLGNDPVVLAGSPFCYMIEGVRVFDCVPRRSKSGVPSLSQKGVCKLDGETSVAAPARGGPVAGKNNVYLAMSGRHIKIGRSAKPKARRADMSTGNPSPIEIVHLWSTEDAHGAIVLERTLHNLFHWSRVSGEWFAASAQMIISIGDLLVAGHEYPARVLADACEILFAQTARYNLAMAHSRLVPNTRGRETKAAYQAFVEDAWASVQAAELTALSLGLRTDIDESVDSPQARRAMVAAMALATAPRLRFARRKDSQ